MAMGHVGTLRARLGLNAQPFNRGLNNAETRTRGFALRVGKHIAVAGAAMAAAAVAGVSVMVKNSMQFIDQQAKIARTIDGSVDGLRALQIAAGDAGVANADLNKSMQMIGARLVEAEVKGGASAKALDRLGLSAKDLLKMDADERLAAMADRVKELGLSSSEATQFLMDMGVRSKEMALLLTGGGDAIRAARQEVDDLGLSLSEVDAAKVEQANDAMSRIKRSTEALGNRLAVAFAPALKNIADGFRESMREGGGFRSFIDGIGARISAIVSGVRDLGTIIAGLVSWWKTLGQEGERFAGLAAGLADFFRPLANIAILSREIIGVFAHLIRTTGGIGEATAALAPLMSEIWGRIKIGFYGLTQQMYAGWLRTRASAVDAAAGMIGAMLGGVNKIIAAFVGAKDAIVAAFGSLPAALRRIGAQAMNGLIEVIASGMSAILVPINAIRELAGKAPIAAPNLSGWKVEVGAATDAAGDAKAAFDAAFGVEYVNASGIEKAARTTADELRAAGDMASDVGRVFLDAAGKPLSEMEKLRRLMNETTADTSDGMNDAATAVTNFDNALGGSGGGSGGSSGPAAKVDKIKSSVEKLNERLSETKSAMQSAFTGMVTGAKSVGEALSDMLKRFSEMLANRAFDGLWKIGVDLGAGGGGGWLGKLVRSFDGGGFTGMGNRSGGMDGKGGFMAMLHPNETVIDHSRGGRNAVGTQNFGVTITMDPSTGNFGAFVTNAAGQEVAKSAPGIVKRSVAAVGASMQKTKGFGAPA